MFVKSIQDVDIWMEIPVQHHVYIWANYFVLIFLNLFQYFEMCKFYWNTIPIFIHHLSLHFDIHVNNVWHHCTDTEVEFGGQYGYLRTNIDIGPEGK